MNSMAARFLTILSALVVAALAQRSPYVRRPFGYPVLEPTSSTSSSVLDDRFSNGENTSTTTTTTQRLPIDALGDRALFESLSKLPAENQPFWLLNWQALEEHRNQASTFQQRPNNFIDSTSFISARSSRNPARFYSRK